MNHRSKVVKSLKGSFLFVTEKLYGCNIGNIDRINTFLSDFLSYITHAHRSIDQQWLGIENKRLHAYLKTFNSYRRFRRMWYKKVTRSISGNNTKKQFSYTTFSPSLLLITRVEDRERCKSIVCIFWYYQPEYSISSRKKLCRKIAILVWLLRTDSRFFRLVRSP